MAVYHILQGGYVALSKAPENSSVASSFSSECLEGATVTTLLNGVAAAVDLAKINIAKY